MTHQDLQVHLSWREGNCFTPHATNMCNGLMLYVQSSGKIGKDGVEDIHISRCIKPHMFGVIMETTLHHFSNASGKEYGQCSYIRLVIDEGKMHCLLVGKARVTSKKFLSNWS